MFIFASQKIAAEDRALREAEAERKAKAEAERKRLADIEKRKQLDAAVLNSRLLRKRRK